MKVVYGLLPEPESTQRAVDSLRAAGISTGNIVILSSEPFEEYAFWQRDSKTPMGWVAAIGGILGGASGFLLASLTQKAYPLPTGAMPILALWPSGIVTYELTMLGAILATLATLLISAGLPNWKAKLSDPGISEGKILVGVINPSEAHRLEAEKSLRQAGAEQLREFGATRNSKLRGSDS